MLETLLCRVAGIFLMEMRGISLIGRTSFYLRALGFNLLACDYRGYDPVKGGQRRLALAAQDLQAAIAWAKDGD